MKTLNFNQLLFSGSATIADYNIQKVQLLPANACRQRNYCQLLHAGSTTIASGCLQIMHL
jgi:hypothetical protein